MTGILPIKKDGSQSAISDFVEYPILYPGEYAEYTGFTENEVIKLCQKYEVDFSEFKDWYDGYHFPECEDIYNPYVEDIIQLYNSCKLNESYKKDYEVVIQSISYRLGHFLLFPFIYIKRMLRK